MGFYVEEKEAGVVICQFLVLETFFQSIVGKREVYSIQQLLVLHAPPTRQPFQPILNVVSASSHKLPHQNTARDTIIPLQNEHSLC